MNNKKVKSDDLQLPDLSGVAKSSVNVSRTYKDFQSLGERHLSEFKKILSGRMSQTSAKEQREINKAIKIARFLALLPYLEE